MFLQTDDQTIEDLRLFARRDQPGIYDLYNNTFTRGGENLLQQFFRAPLSDQEAITRRATIISSFSAMQTPFPFKGAVLDNVEKYMAHSGVSANDPLQKMSLSEKDISSGVNAVLDLLHAIKVFLVQGDIIKIAALQTEREQLLQVLANDSLLPVFNEKPGNKLSYAAVTAFDVLMRVKEKEKVLAALSFIYQLDVFISVATIAREKGFVFPTAYPKGKAMLLLEGVFYPELRSAVANDFSMGQKNNVVFLTGANMAGKSTFLRAVSTAVYMAHMGFPVAATRMEFAVMDGIYTTINLPDNLGIGASHFYAEVLRVKKVATELGAGKSLFIIFDELFRGTNVKDAHEGTVAITQGFASKVQSLFIISSHIVEAGEALSRLPNIGFQFLPTRMNGHVPEYTYKLEPGISEDRHGMIIIRNEGILQTLKRGNKGRHLQTNQPVS